MTEVFTVYKSKCRFDNNTCKTIDDSMEIVGVYQNKKEAGEVINKMKEELDSRYEETDMCQLKTLFVDSTYCQVTALLGGWLGISETYYVMPRLRA